MTTDTLIAKQRAEIVTAIGEIYLLNGSEHAIESAIKIIEKLLISRASQEVAGASKGVDRHVVVDLSVESMTPLEGLDAIYSHYSTTFGRWPDEFMAKVMGETHQRLMLWFGTHREAIRAALVAQESHPAAREVVQERASVPGEALEPGTLFVKLADMLESNGRVTWFVYLARSADASIFDCLQIYSSASKGRAEYERDKLRHFLGQGPEPDLLAYDTDLPAAHQEPKAGWRLVPVEPTNEMIAEGGGVFWDDEGFSATEVWEAMLAAAPTQPQGE